MLRFMFEVSVYFSINFVVAIALILKLNLLLFDIPYVTRSKKDMIYENTKLKLLFFVENSVVFFLLFR